MVHRLQELGFREVHRSQQYRGAAESADVIGIPGVHIEAKRCERFSICAAYEQSVHDSEGLKTYLQYFIVATGNLGLW